MALGSASGIVAPSISIPHLLGLIAGALCISFAPIFAVLSTRGETGVGMWDAAFWRVSIGAVALGILFACQRKPLVPRRSEFIGLSGWIWLPGVIFALDFWAWHWSFAHTSVANSTLLANTSILWVTVFAWLVWKERITRRFVGGAIIAFGGMALLLLSSTTREPPAEGTPLFGDGLALLTAVFYASYQLAMKYYRRTHSAPLLMFWASAVAAICLLPLAILHEDRLLPGAWQGWLPLIGIGVLSHACGQGLIAWSLGHLPASLAAVTLLVQPVATAFLGLAILGQALVPWQVAGAAAVVCGLFVAIRGRAPDPGRTRS